MKRWLICLALVLLAGCDTQELYSKLSEREANEMVAALRAAGIGADKVAQEGTFAVTTTRGDFPAAVSALDARGLPHEHFADLCTVFKREGFVSSPTEERARMLCALSQEIANTIADIDGVITARVHLSMPEHNPLSDKPQPSGASVFIKHRADKDLASQVTQIKALVVNSIEGLSYDNVTVALFPADNTLPDPGKPSGPAGRPKGRPVSASFGVSAETTLASGAAAGMLVFGSGGMIWLRRRRVPQHKAN
jgi:type III secretion protein J